MKTRKIMSLVVVIAMVLSMMPSVISAQDALTVAFDTKTLGIQGERSLTAQAGLRRSRMPVSAGIRTGQ